MGEVIPIFSRKGRLVRGPDEPDGVPASDKELPGRAPITTGDIIVAMAFGAALGWAFFR